MSSLEGSPLPLTCWVKTDVRCIIVDASGSWHALWGFARSEAVGKSTSILNGTGFDSTAAAAVMAQLDTNGHSSMHCTNTSKDGTIYSHDLV